jgi:hypothetical protein
MPHKKPDTVSLWKSELGEDLVNELEVTNNLKSILPNSPAIYLWKLRITPTPAQSASPITYTSWLNDLCSTPLGRVISKPLSHYLQLNDLELRGRGLPDHKQAFFLEFLSTRPGRIWMTKFLRGLNEHIPALYVGETDQLATRTKQHLTGESDFGQQIIGTMDLTWRQLEIYYAPVTHANEERATAARRSFEYITACLTVAGFTNRPG